jgi:hypothetical protein
MNLINFMMMAIDNALFSGEINAINAIKQARTEFNLKQKLFGVNAIVKNGLKLKIKQVK